MWLILRNLRRRPRRTLLTLAGVALATSVYLLLVGTATALVEHFARFSSLFGAHLVAQEAGAATPLASALDRSHLERLATLPGVAAVSRLGLGRTRLLGTPYLLVFGLDPAEPLLSRLAVTAGRAPSAGASEVMLGVHAAARLRLGPGDRIEIRGQEVSVCGVHRTGHGLVDAGAVLDLALAQRLFNLHDTVNLAFADVARGADPSSVVRDAARLAPSLEVATAERWADSFPQLDLVSGYARFLGGLALAMVLLGVANVMHLVVAEQQQELAVLRALGWRRRRIAALVLGEGVAVCLAGGLLALPATAAALLVLGSPHLAPIDAGGFLPDRLHPALALEGIGVTLMAGTLGVLAPMLRALRLRPAEALRAA